MGGAVGWAGVSWDGLMPPIMPHDPAPYAKLAIYFFYMLGLALLLEGWAQSSIGAAIAGGVLIFGGVYYTVQWFRAKRKDSISRR